LLDSSTNNTHINLLT